MLLTITISTKLCIYLIVVLLSTLAGCALLFFIIGTEKGWLNGFKAGEDKFAGRPITLDKTWIGVQFWPNRVFTQLGDDHSGGEFVYLLEAKLHLESDSPKLFKISKEEYEQLLLDDKKTLGKEYEYTSKVIQPGIDKYYFKKMVGMHDTV